MAEIEKIPHRRSAYRIVANLISEAVEGCGPCDDLAREARDELLHIRDALAGATLPNARAVVLALLAEANASGQAESPGLRRLKMPKHVAALPDLTFDDVWPAVHRG